MATPQVTDQPASAALKAARGHIVEALILVLLVALSGLGVAINDYSPGDAYTYWLWMAPTFGVICTASAITRARTHGQSALLAAERQLLHWAGVIGAVYLVYTLQTTGRMQNEAAGLAALTVIALAAFLAGVHSDWRLMVVGVVLGVTVVGFAVLERIIWLVVIPAFGLIAVAVLVLARLASRRMRRKTAG